MNLEHKHETSHESAELSHHEDVEREALENMKRELKRLRNDLDLLESPETICAFGQMKMDGDGVEQNLEEAAVWFRMAADRGLARAQHNLALLHEEGLGVPQDTALAAKYYRMAADQGHAGSLNNLGRLYEMGDGVLKDSMAALDLYRKSAEAGDSNGATNMRRLETILREGGT